MNRSKTTRWIVLIAVAVIAVAVGVWASSPTGADHSKGAAATAGGNAAADHAAAGSDKEADDAHAGHDHGEQDTDAHAEPAADPHAGHDHKVPTGPVTADELRQLTMLSNDPAQAGEVAAYVRERLKGEVPDQYKTFLRRLLVRSLIVGEAPVKEIVTEAESLGPDIPQAGGMRVLFYVEVAQALVDRNAEPKRAVVYANKALAEIPPDEMTPEVSAVVRGVLGRAYLANNECQPAIDNLSVAVTLLPDSQTVLYGLGSAYEKCGKKDAAMHHYIRSLGVYGGGNHSAAEPLQALYRAKHGSLDGLSEKIEQARTASLNKEVFEARTYEAAAPAWSLEDDAGKVVNSKDFAGKIVVLDFWGSWCGPCRMELPHFQAMYEKYKDKGVVFYGINWERVSREQRKAVAQAYMEENGFDFPVVYDLTDRTPMDFKVQSFPTVFLIDGKGKIRYRNIGFSEGIGEIMSLQLDSLLAEQGGKKSAKR